MKQSKKNVNIELLRVISMLMIVYHHYYHHSGWEFPNYFSTRTIFLRIVGTFGKVGVVIFVLITGYFYSQQSFKIKKIFQLSNIARWYSIFSIGIVYFLIDRNFHLSVQEIITAIFPIEYQTYWFLTPYIFVLLLNPFFKNYLVSLEREKKLRATVILIIVLHIPSFIGIMSQTEGYFIPNNFIVFIYIVMVGDLIKSYQNELLTIYFKYVVLFFLFSLILIIYKAIIYQPFIIEYLPKMPGFFLTDTESINALVFSSTLFIIIMKLKIRGQSLVLLISPLVFDVYLLHDNKFIRPLIWGTIFNNKAFFYSSDLFIRSLLEPILVFSVCLFFAFIRIRVFNILTRYLYTVKRK